MTLMIWASEGKNLILLFVGEGTKLDFLLSEMIKTNLIKALIGMVLRPTRIWPWAFTKLSWPCRLPDATFLCSFGVHDQRRRDVKLALQIAIRYVLVFFQCARPKKKRCQTCHLIILQPAVTEWGFHYSFTEAPWKHHVRHSAGILACGWWPKSQENKKSWLLCLWPNTHWPKDDLASSKEISRPFLYVYWRWKLATCNLFDRAIILIKWTQR